jgi:hypothetical protein
MEPSAWRGKGQLISDPNVGSRKRLDLTPDFLTRLIGEWIDERR